MYCFGGFVLTRLKWWKVQQLRLVLSKLQNKIMFIFTDLNLLTPFLYFTKTKFTLFKLNVGLFSKLLLRNCFRLWNSKNQCFFFHFHILERYFIVVFLKGSRGGSSLAKCAQVVCHRDTNSERLGRYWNIWKPPVNSESLKPIGMSWKKPQ